MAREPRCTGGTAYAVGYGKPPERTRFQKGRSGNPAGRPKGALDLGALLDKALAEKVVVKDASGRRREITKGEALVIQLVNKAAGADPRATGMVFDLVAKRRAREGQADGAGLGEGDAPPAAGRPDLSIDWSGMTTAELRVAAEFMRIIDRRSESPPADCPMPPAGPGGGEPGAGDPPLRWYTPSPGYPPGNGEEGD